MGTTTEKLTYLQGTKDAIKNAIVAKGVEVPEGTTFRGYAEKVGEIPAGAKIETVKVKFTRTKNTVSVMYCCVNNGIVVSKRIRTNDILSENQYFMEDVLLNDFIVIRFGANPISTDLEKIGNDISDYFGYQTIKANKSGYIGDFKDASEEIPAP